MKLPAIDSSKYGEKFEESIAGNFIDTYKFLTSKSGPALQLDEALTVSEKVAARGVLALKNFVDGYRFAVSDRGLKLPQNKAMDFGIAMAEKTDSQSFFRNIAGKR